jgi:CRP/FNR family transcriptional regulator, cyclic AMP receptor protein
LLQRLIHHDGDELIVSFRGSGDVVGLTESVLATPAQRETLAGDDCAVLSIPWRIVAGIAERELWARIAAELAGEQLELLRKLGAVSFSSLEGRVAAFLLDMQRLERRTDSLRVSQAMIAQAVGASRPKVNRCLKSLERKGAIQYRGRELPQVLDRAALIRLV